MNRIKVIICEDHSLFREGIKAYLNNREDIVCVGAAENGAQLLYLLKHKSSEDFPDIVLLDINMPIMGGEEALEIIKQEYPNLKVIMLTMHNQVSMVEKMMAMGANSYVPKSEAADQIVKAILSVHATNYYFNDLINQALVQSVRKSKLSEHTPKEETVEVVDVVKPQVEEEVITKVKPSFFKKILVSTLYAILAAVVLSLIVYIMLVISSNLSEVIGVTGIVTPNPTFVDIQSLEDLYIYK